MCNLLLATALLGLAALMIAANHAFRVLEAELAAFWLDPQTPGGVTSAGTSFVLQSTPFGPAAFQITTECTAVVLMVPLLVFGACLLLLPNARWHRALLAVLTGMVAVVAVNQIRLGVIAWATRVWGIDPGYDFSHVLVGSVIGIVGFVGAVVAMVAIVGLRRGRRRDP